MVEISREAYAALYGPTTGDQVRLGDTDLWIEVEDDLTFGGEEAVFGGGKSIHESMAQSAVPRAGGALDTVITNVVVLVVVASIASQFVPDRTVTGWKTSYSRLNPLLQGVAFGVGLLLVDAFGPEGVAPFIYFQF